jgi:BON domain
VDLHAFRQDPLETKTPGPGLKLSCPESVVLKEASVMLHTKFDRLDRIRLSAVAVLAGGFVLQAGAQDLAFLSGAPAGTRTSEAAAPESPANEARRLRVETALHDDPYFNDSHVTVVLRNGVVILQGFVSTEWDLLHAIRIAKSAAGDGRVVDDLYLDLGGRR